MCFNGNGKAVGSDFRRIPECGGAELMRAHFNDFQFRKHAHERLAFGIVTEGAMQIDTAHGSYVAERGNVITFNPDMVHWGRGAGVTNWVQNTMLIDEYSFADVLEDIAGHRIGDKFSSPVIDDRALYLKFRGVHACLSDSKDALQREGFLLDFVSTVSERAGLTDEPTERLDEPDAVSRVRDYIDSHFAEQITLDELAVLTGVGGYRLTRAFKKSVGMPPHAYQVHRRVRQAENLLRGGMRPVDVAAECGFADQAHLTRAFRQANALTPAQFRAG